VLLYSISLQNRCFSPDSTRERRVFPRPYFGCSLYGFILSCERPESCPVLFAADMDFPLFASLPLLSLDSLSTSLTMASPFPAPVAESTSRKIRPGVELRDYRLDRDDGKMCVSRSHLSALSRLNNTTGDDAD
jgi:hypothetical protein